MQKLGLIGLTEAGTSLANQLRDAGYDLVVFSISKQEQPLRDKVHVVHSLEDLALALESKRIIWLMEDERNKDDVLDELIPNLSVSDIILDGSPSPFAATRMRYQNLQGVQIDLLDCALVQAKENKGDKICLVVGGNKFAFNYCQPLFESIAGSTGFIYGGTGGAGHIANHVYKNVLSKLVSSTVDVSRLFDQAGGVVYSTEIINHLKRNGLLGDLSGD
jgi:6-phosphogluconate dehydrogenase